MCGIAGFLTSATFDREAALRSMSRRLSHRGPDASGEFIAPEQGFYLAHRRLSIIDLSAASNQPLANEDATIHVAVNGEFYNYRELKGLLKARGHRFKSQGDTEVLVHGYEEWGEDVFRRVEGIFAIALWDGPKRSLFLARDPLGVKPLVYSLNRHGLFFSSEAQVFHELPRSIFSPSFDNTALDQLLCFQYIYDPERTAYRGVRRVLPGTFLKFNDGNMEETTFWSLPQSDGNGSDPSLAAEDVEQKLRQAVRSQMVSDAPMGILLSGGLDSSVIAALAQEVREEPISTFTAGFEHGLDERSYARQVANHLGTNHREVLIDPGEINGRLEELVPKLDDLTSLDGGMFTVHLISEKIAAQGIKVLLVGEGSDEVFGGYSWFGLSRLPFSGAGEFLRSAIFTYCISRMIPMPRNLIHTRRIHRIMKGYGHDDIFRTISHFEIARQLPNHFLMKVDHGTMALGIEARVPYLDRELVETVFRLPGKAKLNGAVFSFHKNNEKVPLRRIARKLLPETIAARKKRGFSIPMPEVLRSNREKMKDLLLSRQSAARHFFSHRSVEALMRFKPSLYSPLDKHREFLCWRLLLIEIWRRHYAVSL